MKIATFAERLAEAMRIREVSQTELHNRTGINKSSISTYLKGQYEAKQNKVYEIARALSVSPAWLMGYDVSMNGEEKENAETGGASAPAIDLDEAAVLSQYRRLSPEGRQYIHDQLHFRLAKEAAEAAEKKKQNPA